MVLTPAYGRDYKCRAEILRDWNEGKDFCVAGLTTGGTYANRSDVERYGAMTVNVRYASLRKVMVLHRDQSKGCWYYKA